MSHVRFEELYERYCDGDLNAGERSEFLKLLEDPGCRARFAELSIYEASIAEEVRLAKAAVSLNDSPTPQGRKPGSKSWPRMRGRHVAPGLSQETSALAIGAAVAAAAVLLGFVAMATSKAPREPRAGAVRPPPAPPRDVRVAEAPASIPEMPSSRERRSVEPVRPPDPPGPPAAPPESGPSPLVVPPRPVPAKPQDKPEPRPEEPAVRESATFVAELERVSGEVKLGMDPGEAGKGVASGQSVATGKSGYALVKFPDGTRFELGPETLLGRVSEGPSGKSALLEQGLLFVDAARQGTGRPLVVSTPQAESTVLGTQFVLTAAAGFTRLDVREGRVKFTRLPQGVSSVVVTAGHYAVAGPAGDLVARPGYGVWKAPPAGLQLWLRADSGVKTSATGVAAWMDQSPAGNPATQPKETAQPSLVPNASSGKPALRFNGTADFLTLPEGFADFRAGLTAFVVVRPGPGGAWSRFFDLDVGPQCDNIVFGRKDAPDKLGFWVYSNSQTKGKIEASGVVQVEQVQCFSALLAPTGRVTLYRNGTPVAAGDTSVPRSVVRKPNAIGKSNSPGDPLFRGDLFEILLYNRALSEPERTYVEAYLTAKYFDPTAPPPSLKPEK